VWNSLGDYDLRPRLPSIAAPILVAHGRQDPIPIESAREIARSTGAELLELDRTGHVPYIEASQRLFPALLAFLD
jgi:pimeloyl-ACP methyl ester carboxylesterase